MKKKIVIISLIILILTSGLFILTGCVKNEDNGNKTDTSISDNSKDNSPKIIVNGMDYKLSD